MKQQYKSYQETVDFLKECVKLYPNLITIKNIGTTGEGRDIVLATISIDVENADLKPALLFTGTVHAREWIGNELSVSFIDYILKNYQTNPKITSALTKNTLYMVPCLNPDGFEYSRTHFSFWRKNRRNNKDGTYGVDLNRNFDVGFIKSTDTSSNVYGGPAPFSEPETAAMRDFVEAHDNIIKKVTGREYGIHRGKPPTKLISGSGREHYYSKGIIAAVVEVGTRNIFDSFSKQELEISHKEDKPASFIVKATTVSSSKEHAVNWYSKEDKQEVKLIIKYIKRSKFAPSPCTNLSTSVEKGMVKLTWENPKQENFTGAYVVRNRFHKPTNPHDGVKLYAGNDNYTYDNFGSPKIDKYYAVFAYDDVPNFSDPEVAFYEGK